MSEGNYLARAGNWAGLRDFEKREMAAWIDRLAQAHEDLLIEHALHGHPAYANRLIKLSRLIERIDVLCAEREDVPTAVLDLRGHAVTVRMHDHDPGSPEDVR